MGFNCAKKCCKLCPPVLFLMQNSNSSLIRLKNALFRYNVPRTTSPSYVFKEPIKSFEITQGIGPSYWGIVGSTKSLFLDIIAAKFIPEPPSSRIYPSISDPSTQIQYLKLRESSGLDRVHLSARYESYSYKGVLEVSDDVNSVENYITGANNYNSNHSIDNELVERIMSSFLLDHLKKKWINSLSNGQMRRARIAKSLITRPKLLVIDDPFLGLDPIATVSVSESLSKIAKELSIGIIVGLRLQDEIPQWITHVGHVNEIGLTISGEKEHVLDLVKEQFNTTLHVQDGKNEQISIPVASIEVDDPIVEFENASVIYEGQPILKAFNWKVQRGSKWRILGANGSGKTTLLSLITADHPQSWRSVIRINGTLRKTGSGVNYFDINDKIGISSPEIHALVPRRMTMADVIMNGLVSGVGNSNFKFHYVLGLESITDFSRSVLDRFRVETVSKWDVEFQHLTVSEQKLALFIRAVIKNPEILIFDEAFSCMDDELLMKKCHEFILLQLPGTTVLTIGHIDWEIPATNYTLKLHGNEDRSYSIYEK